LVTTALLIILKTGSRIFIGDWFPVNTVSMMPTIIPGDKIWVNKLIFGARVYKNLDFLDEKPLKTFRVKGWRKIKKGDVVVFNAPIQKTRRDSIVFKIDYVYVKRCAGTPGETVTTPRSEWHHHRRDTVHRSNIQWYSGVVYVPKKGDTLFLNRANRRLYHTLIAYETKGLMPEKYHICLNNYYFMCGDNVSESYDSRYFGFVPEEFIIGISKRVLINNRDGWRQKFKGRRILKRME
jgi:signal peptidase I